MFDIITGSLIALFFCSTLYQAYQVKRIQKEYEALKERYQDVYNLSVQLGTKLQDKKAQEEHLFNSLSDLNKKYEQLDNTYKEKLAVWKVTTEKEIRQDANQRSRSVLRGQATEHLAPYLMPDYPLKDFRFIGDPVDYLITLGASAIHDGETDLIERVVLLDIKTGNSKLNKVQRRIRDAIVDGRVYFMTYNPDTEETKEWKYDSSTI